MKRIVILGATSAIARGVERIAAEHGRELLLVARDQERLDLQRADLLARGATSVQTYTADLSNPEQHEGLVRFASTEFQGFDTILIAYGSLIGDCESNPEKIAEQIQTDFVSAAMLVTRFANEFRMQKSGCIAVITSVAGDRGRASNYTYGAAKGGLSLFLQGLRQSLHADGVKVITIKPGPVRTPMTAGMRQTFLFADVQRVATSIFAALERRGPDVVYTPAYWRIVMFVIRAVPERIFKRLSL